MKWLLIGGVLVVGATLLLTELALRRRARRTRAAWRAHGRSGTLAWTLFTRRARQPRLTDRRKG